MKISCVWNSVSEYMISQCTCIIEASAGVCAVFSTSMQIMP
jgi:hypothetical protein